MHDLAVTLPAHVIEAWDSRVPARKLAALRALGIGDDDERWRAWRFELTNEWERVATSHIDSSIRRMGHEYTTQDWLNYFANNDRGGNYVPESLGSAYLDCLFGAEFAAERETCQMCEGRKICREFRGEYQCSNCHGLGSVRATVECPACRYAIVQRKAVDARFNCVRCNNTGRIPAPLIDSRWITDHAIGLARAIRGEARRAFETPLIQMQGKSVWRDGTIKVWLDEPHPDIGERIDLKCPDDDSDYKPGRILHGLLVVGAGKSRRSWVLKQDEYSVPSHPPCPDRMPILHDALMDAGCDNAELLAHCRSDGPHLAQCWVPNLILGGK